MTGRIAVLGKGFFALAVVMLGFPVHGEPTPGSSDRLIVGLTLPSDGHARELKFESQGTIKSVDVKPGDHVKAGQVLMKQDDRKEVAELEGLKADATLLKVRQAKTQADKAHADVRRLEAIEKESQNAAEMDRAKAEAEYYDLQIDVEKQDLAVKQHKIERQAAVVDNMQLRSPVDGYVLSVDSLAGETADPQKPAIKIVANDPLQVQLVLSTATSQKLKMGEKMRVSYDRKKWADASVSYIAPQALGVGTQKVWLQLANAEKRDSGLQIYVELPQDAAVGDADTGISAASRTESASTVR